MMQEKPSPLPECGEADGKKSWIEVLIRNTNATVEIEGKQVLIAALAMQELEDLRGQILKHGRTQV